MTDQPVAAQILAFGSIATHPTWTQLIVPSATGGGTRWGFLRVMNGTNVRIEGKFGTGSDGHFYINDGDSDEWNITRDTVAGTVFVRAASAAAEPASGDVTADGLV